MKRYLILYLILVLITSTSCKKEITVAKTTYINTDTITSEIIADTIIYDVLIKNTNPDDLWTDECLKYLHRNNFMDSLFSAIYRGDLIAYDFFTNKPLSIKEVTTIEKSDWYDRDAIGKMQFSEVWYFDSKYIVFKKKVISITFGVEQFTSLNELKGHKPLFKVYLN
jgi:hypothetical protein